MSRTARRGRVRSLIDGIRQGTTAGERRRLAGMIGFILLLNVGGWAIVAVVTPDRYSIGNGTFGVGTGVLAYTLGMRHAFDADHIAAIDNTTRKLMSERKRPLSVGFWFSLGHSSVVFGLCLLLAFGVRSLVGPVADDSSGLHHYTNLFGTSISGTFLYLIAIFNIIVLVGILRMFLGLRRGEYNEALLEEHLDKRGLINRLLGRVMRSISRPGQMYPIGFLFGLGFDTATEVALLVVASTSALGGLPWYAIVSLPILFAAGMSLFDTIDGTFMNFAYEWAFSQPVRKLYYNITITGLSIAVALLIGSVELLGLLGQELNLNGWFWTTMADTNINTLGFIIVGLFVVTWAVALTVWRFGRVEERWSAGLQSSAVANGEVGSETEASAGNGIAGSPETAETTAVISTATAVGEVTMAP